MIRRGPRTNLDAAMTPPKRFRGEEATIARESVQYAWCVQGRCVLGLVDGVERAGEILRVRVRVGLWNVAPREAYVRFTWVSDDCQYNLFQTWAPVGDLVPLSESSPGL